MQDYSSHRVPTAIRQGRTVTIYGAVKNKYTINASIENIFRVLPVDMRPMADLNFVEQGSGNGIYMLRIKPNGEMSINRGRMGASNYNFPAGSWFNINCTFNIEY